MAATAMFSSSLFPTSHLNKSSSSSSSKFSQIRYRLPLRLSIRASLLQDKEDKVVLQDSFPSKTSPLDSVTENSTNDDDTSSTSAWEKGVIKVEQSVNIFLTVILFLI
jgi:ubiquinol oxidase